MMFKKETKNSAWEQGRRTKDKMLRLMKKWMLSKANQVLAICLAILGVPGCKEPEAPMYGSPHATFTAEGNVTNETAEPIEGVKVTVDGCYQSGSCELSFAITGTDGYYRTPQGDIAPTDSIWIYANDTTGVYAPDSAKVRITYDRSHTEAWYEGDGSAKADFVLKKKSTQ